VGIDLDSVGAGPWTVVGEGRTGTNAPTGMGRTPFTEVEETTGAAETAGRQRRDVADKGGRSFLRQDESQQYYNAKGTACKRLFSE